MRRRKVSKTGASIPSACSFSRTSDLYQWKWNACNLRHPGFAGKGGGCGFHDYTHSSQWGALRKACLARTAGRSPRKACASIGNIRPSFPLFATCPSHVTLCRPGLSTSETRPEWWRGTPNWGQFQRGCPFTFSRTTHNHPQFCVRHTNGGSRSKNTRGASSGLALLPPSVALTS